MRYIVRYSLVFLFFCPSILHGQSNGPYAGEIRKAAAIIESAHNMSYKYSMNAEYPNGETDHVDGEVYINEQGKLFYNVNDAFSMLYTNQWFYKADHRKKTIAIVNLEKHLNKDYKEGIEHDVFETGTLSKYFDSIIIQFATVKSLKKTGDSVRMELVFPEKSPVRSIKIAYDGKEKILIGYSIQSFEPWRTNEFGKNKGTTKTMACFDFRKVENDKKYQTDNFFSVKKNKVVLKKYRKYKLESKI